jgi:hypothetical protein
MSKDLISSHYNYVVWGGRTFSVGAFFKQFPDCRVKEIKHLKGEVVRERNGSYDHPLRGCAFTSMGELELFNYSDKE